MKLSFSTLACPGFAFGDVCSMAKDLGFDGIELRGEGLSGNLPLVDVHDNKIPAFSETKIEKSLKLLESLGLEVSCLSDGASLRTRSKIKENIAEIRLYIDAAKRIGTKFIRLLGDDGPMPCGVHDEKAVFEVLSEVLPYAAEKNITLLIETNGVYTDSEKLSTLLSSLESDYVGALWDIHHTFRYGGEEPEKTVQNLGVYIKYVHLKDSVSGADGKPVYKITGNGDVPLDDAMKALDSINYEGFITFEWVKKWIPEMDAAGIVFPQFVEFMAQYMGKSSQTGRLIPNNAGTGYYVWEKNSLIDLTFPQVLDRMVEEFPDKWAFRYTTCDYSRTYKEFRADVDEFAAALISLGVRRGDHVAVWAANVPEWYITFWATTKIGAVLVTVNTAYKIYEVEYLLRQSDTHTLVMTKGFKDTDYAEIVTEICPELKTHIPGKPLHAKKLPFLRNVITVGYKKDGCLEWSEALEYAKFTPKEEVFRRASGINKNDVCNIQYTSGTTGFPKGVMLTHYNVVNNGKNIGDCLDLSTADRMMIQVPMFHCFGMVLSMTASMTHGVTMSPIPFFSAPVSLDCINKEKITAFNGVPTMFIAMLSHPDFEKTDFSYMRTGIMAGSPCPVKVMEEVLDKMNMKDICITYGQTEASPGCTMSKTTDSIETRVNTVGSAMFGVECKITDPETGKDCNDNVDGEFLARGYNIMKGYYKMPHATALAIDSDGWLHTGDIARRLPDGNFRITGRIKDMIIRGGENLYPKEIEDFLYTHPKIKDVQVIGLPDKRYGEEACAVIIVKENETLTEDEVKDYVLTHMAKHKVPRYVRFVDSFPMNAAGKILKYKMREDAASFFKITNE